MRRLHFGAFGRVYDEGSENYILPNANLTFASYNISVQEDIVTVNYSTEQYFCRLSVYKKGGIVHKTIQEVEKPMLTEGGQRISYDSNPVICEISNAGNMQFRFRVRETGLAALFD